MKVVLSRVLRAYPGQCTDGEDKKWWTPWQVSERQKAKRELGYRPQIDLEEGMEVAEEWARWARYI